MPFTLFGVAWIWWRRDVCCRRQRQPRLFQRPCADVTGELSGLPHSLHLSSALLVKNNDSPFSTLATPTRRRCTYEGGLGGLHLFPPLSRRRGRLHLSSRVRRLLLYATTSPAVSNPRTQGYSSLDHQWRLLLSNRLRSPPGPPWMALGLCGVWQPSPARSAYIFGQLCPGRVDKRRCGTPPTGLLSAPVKHNSHAWE